MRAWIYEHTFRKITDGWYAAVLERLPRGARLLDVGIGTGGALVRSAQTLQDRDLRVVGVDIDGDYLRLAEENLRREGLTGRVQVHHKSILDFDEGPFDAAYFGASFMLMPDPVGVLRHIQRLLLPGAKVYFTQTIEEQRRPFIEKIKPFLHRLTTIHFGKVTYEEEFLQTLSDADMELVDEARLGGNQARSWRLFVAQPRRALALAQGGV